ncbi:MAG: hypothetical protein FWD66_11220 [Paludibacter sp.]|nr:hypothetical protein [Paludibacter sp.]
MAEEEKIREHAKHALQDLFDKSKKWKDRIKDFAWEVFIIIVAVNITLWFHSWSEKRHERELEKNFLIGIRGDLGIINQKLIGDSIFNQPIFNYYDSIDTQITNHRIDKAFADANSSNLLSDSYFVYDNSRFENFKSSGYLRLIENDSLALVIAYLYTIAFPNIKDMDKIVNDNMSDLLTYLYANSRLNSSKSFIVSDLLNTSEGTSRIIVRKSLISNRRDLKEGVKYGVRIIKNRIDDELKSRFNYEVKNPNREINN